MYISTWTEKRIQYSVTMRTIQYGFVNSAVGQIPCSTERISCYNNVRYLLNCWHTTQLTILTSAMQGRTQQLPCRAALYTKWLSRLNCCHTRRTVWTFTRWGDQHTSDKVAHYSIYRPRKDERLSWPWVAGYMYTEIKCRLRESNPDTSPIPVLTGLDVE